MNEQQQGRRKSKSRAVLANIVKSLVPVEENYCRANEQIRWKHFEVKHKVIACLGGKGETFTDNDRTCTFTVDDDVYIFTEGTYAFARSLSSAPGLLTHARS